MENINLIHHVVPSGGWYCAIGIPPAKNKGPITKFTKDTDELKTFFEGFIASGHHTYFALAKYNNDAPKPLPEGGRKIIHAEALQSLWLDIDCGPGKDTEIEQSTGLPKGYASKKEGYKAAKKFWELLDLPPPTIVDSGNGWHLYWAFTEEVPRDQWIPLADRLKEVCATQKFAADPNVFDAARMLRVPESFNVKTDPPKEVKVAPLAPPIDVSIVREALGVEEDAVVETKAPVEVEFDPGQNLPSLDMQYNFARIAKRSLKDEGCKQIKDCIKDRATLSEPRWFNILSIAKFCEDSATAIHLVSKGHPDYTPAGAEQKILHIKGPHGCDKFALHNPKACRGCPHKKLIKSPRDLGLRVNKDVAPKFDLPDGYYRGESGGIYTDVGEEPRVVYEYDLFIKGRMRDTEEGDKFVIHAHTPMDGTNEFVIANVQLEHRELRRELAKEGVVAPEGQSKLITSYIISAIIALQKQGKKQYMYNQFGWHENYSKFIVGEREINKDGVYHTPASSVTSGLAPHFVPKGTLEKWKEVFNMYDRPGLEVQAFAALSGFGSPLLALTGQKGAVINLMHSLSGQGKTTVLRVINSVCGHPDMLLGAPDDTIAARIQKMGVLNNIANTMDELTNMDGEYISNFLYACSQGKGRERMESNKNANRLNTTTWRATTVSTANASMRQKVQDVKEQADGELMRLIELNVPASDPTIIGTSEGKEIFDQQLLDNYGTVIEPFIINVINNFEEVKSTLKRVAARFDKALDMTQRERNWSAISACNITAGLFAQDWGLIDMDVKRVYHKIIPVLADMKENTTAPLDDASSIVGDYIGRNWRNSLVILKEADQRSGKKLAATREPIGQLVVRFEPDTQRMYTPVKKFRQHCSEGQVNYTSFLKETTASGMCLGTKNYRMASGTELVSTAQRCLVFNTAHVGFIDISGLTEQDTDVDGGESSVPD
tara:strand:- start:2773 stop:5607 length:2835 start_codon:yes stop_codon:yes gene_type:complete